MAGYRAHTRPPRGPQQRPRWLTAASEIVSFLDDAAHTPGGHAAAVALPETEGEVAWLLERADGPILPVGAQSSLTGGATPFGGTAVATHAMTSWAMKDSLRVVAGAGLTLSDLQKHLSPHGLDYPPVSTYLGATVGGTIATNAAGATTFKHGTTRAWVEGLTVVLPSGEVLELARGEVQASAEGRFEIVDSGGSVVALQVPQYRWPDVPKCSAGYFAANGMDLVDLFIGAEGTLGIVTEVVLRVRPSVSRLAVWATLPSESQALALVGALRDAARATWRTRDPRGIDVAAIESLDRRSLDLVRADGVDRQHAIRIPREAHTALLLQAELPPGVGAAEATAQLDTLDDPMADGTVVRLVRLLAEHVDLEDLELVWPGETRRLEQLQAVREAVPEAVNRRVALAQASHGSGVRKVAADMIVPFRELEAMTVRYHAALDERSLDHAVWGHVSDGNLHVNVIPRAPEDVEVGAAALLELGDEVIRRGGSPLAEHGVGRNPVKQALLEKLVGASGVRQMVAVKRALDPQARLAPDVLFPSTAPDDSSEEQG